MQAELNLNARTKQEDTTVEGYQFEPIKGYPMLQWQGKRPFTSTQFYPAQLKESYGEETDGWMNQIFWGDNLQVMSHLLKKYRGQADLIYIDPPFDSKADYKKKIQLRNKSVSNDATAFEERQYSDIWTNDEYLQYMYERIIMMREILKDGGAFILHCDTKKNHLLRVVLDEIFGPNSFQNEIVRIKCNPKNSERKAFGNIHDILYFYTKGSEQNLNWTQQKEPLNSDDIKRIFDKKTENGKNYTTVALHAPGERSGETGKAWRGILPPSGRHWAFVHKTLDELEEKNRIEWSSKGVPRLIRYADDKEGDIVQDIWTIKDPQYTRYPTEKPEKLIERLLNSLTFPGDLVFDCFMGSGTTQAVAMKLGRRFLGADINLGAIQTTTKRLVKVANDLNGKVSDGKVYTGFQVYNVNHYDVFRNPLEAKELLMKALEIEAAPGGGLFDGEKDGRLVKVMPVNRIATRADLNEILSNIDLKAYEKKKAETPNRPVEQITLVCMGHEPDLAAQLKNEIKTMGYTVDVEVVDVLRDRSKLEFKRDAEAEITVENNQLLVREFYPMNLLQKLSLMKEDVGDWKELVESVLIDWNYDGAVLEPKTIDIPEGSNFVRGVYPVPANHGIIRVKITDLLSESLEQTVTIY